MSASIHNTKPNFAIFLDIDGVLGNEPLNYDHTSNMNTIIHEKLGGEAFHAFSCSTRCSTCATASAHLFVKEAIDSFHKLIAKIQDIANVHIVISSTWRTGRSIDELKKIFSIHTFSGLITDKTIDDGILSFPELQDHCIYPHIEPTRENILKNCKNHVFDMNNTELNSFLDQNCECRASQINRWLKNHPEYVTYLVIDDRDDHLKLNFEDKFISTMHLEGKILTLEDTEKAYNIAVRQIGEYNVSFNT